jgi:hypothetical protein
VAANLSELNFRAEHLCSLSSSGFEQGFGIAEGEYFLSFPVAYVLSWRNLEAKACGSG